MDELSDTSIAEKINAIDTSGIKTNAELKQFGYDDIANDEQLMKAYAEHVLGYT
jgi:hypothetical protein